MKNIRILMIGNSFSDDTIEHVYPILRDMGYDEIVLGNLYIGGCSINMHLGNLLNDVPVYYYRLNTEGTWVTTPGTRMSDALRSEPWDIISMQSGTSDGSGNTNLATFARLPRFIALVRSYVPQAKLVWNMTWVGEPGCSHRDYLLYDCDGDKQYRDMMTTVRACVLTCPEITCIAATGTAVENARSSYLGKHLCRDYYHLSLGMGRYVAGLTFAAAVTGGNLGAVKFAPEEVDERMKAVALEAAANAVRSPFAITPATDR